MARRIVAAGPGAHGGPVGLLEQIFGRQGDAAVAAALAHWGLTEFYGETPPTEDLRAVAESLLELLL